MSSQPIEQSTPFRWLLLPFAVVLLAGCLTLHYYSHFMLVGGDAVCYYLSSVWLGQGLVPYRDFALQYPPLSLVPFDLPQLVVFFHRLSFYQYLNVYLVQSALLCALLMFVLLQTVKSARVSVSPRSAATVFTALVVILSPMLPWRYDLFPALLTLLALLGIVKGRPGWAGVSLGLGVAAKLYPVVLLPVFGLYYGASRQYRALGQLMLGTTGAILLSLLPFAPIGPSTLFSFLHWQGDRGLEIGSVASGLLLAAHSLGMGRMGLNFVLGADQLNSPAARLALDLLPWAFAVTYSLALAICGRRFRREFIVEGRVSAESLAVFSTVAIVIFIVTSRVFSPQYLLWLLPFAPLLRAPLRRLLAVIFLMTSALFPFLFLSLLAMTPGVVLLLNARNLLMVLLLMALLQVRRSASVSESMMPSLRPTGGRPLQTDTLFRYNIFTDTERR